MKLHVPAAAASIRRVVGEPCYWHFQIRAYGYGIFWPVLEQASSAWEGQHKATLQIGIVENICARTW